VIGWGEVFINPRVVATDKPIPVTEGCLSLPDVTAIVAAGREFARQRAASAQASGQL